MLLALVALGAHFDQPAAVTVPPRPPPWPTLSQVVLFSIGVGETARHLQVFALQVFALQLRPAWPAVTNRDQL